MTKSSIFSPILIAGSVILMVGFAIRASFGVFQIPIAAEFGWPGRCMTSRADMVWFGGLGWAWVRFRRWCICPFAKTAFP